MSLTELSDLMSINLEYCNSGINRGSIQLKVYALGKWHGITFPAELRGNSARDVYNLGSYLIELGKRLQTTLVEETGKLAPQQMCEQYAQLLDYQMEEDWTKADSAFSKFIREAEDKEKKEVYDRVMDRAAQMQKVTMLKTSNSVVPNIGVSDESERAENLKGK